MKFLLLLIFIVLINLMNVRADIVDVNFGKENYASQETLQAEINFNINLLKQITVLNFELLDNEGNKIPVGYFLTKLDNREYYVYFNLPNINSGDYTLKIKDVTYIDENNILKKESKESKFSIINKDFIIQVDPAILKVDNPNDFPEFTIKIKNLANLTNITIGTEDEFIQLFNTFSIINKNEVKTFKIIIDSNNLDNFNKGNINVVYNNETYIIPVYLIRDLQDLPERNIPQDAIGFIEENNIINKTLFLDESIEGSLRFKNFFNETILNLKFELTNNLNEVIELELIDVSINENETKEQYLIINKNINATAKFYSGDLILKNQDIRILFPIYLNFKEREQIKEEVEDNITVEEKENKTTNLFEETEAEEEEKDISENKKTLIIVLMVILITLIALGLGAYFKRKKVIKQSFSEFAESFEKKK